MIREEEARGVKEGMGSMSYESGAGVGQGVG